MTTAAKKRPKRRKLAWYLRPFKWLLWFVAISVLWVLLYAVVPPPVTFTMLADSNGITKDWTSLSGIDRNMVRAVIAAEDGKFCSHNGFDTEAIEQAIERNAKGKRMRGGSTVSQQTAKNVFLWQGSGWTRYVRKVPEVWFTFLIETIWGKRRIMEVYLNVAETGIGTYGVEAGAQRYFKHGAGKLTPAEAARIAAILPLPKKREAVSPSGFTRRYGNTIRARIGQVRRDGLDGCVYN
ncbi:MAG: monofunctional biosynthetic peptidoglycan transglycosylase [Alphaproteobacteria bacterium]|nr:monofunctional biosynthetic peptidoglycan transglycosylase [Alphaproteobacteria bacterium]MBU0863604.1 monofunctional biosynthetic peptidoglycan transglycosylase [Alphaproteobacteria bacterium]MBU1825933.1 monofunctional biosynthetic peptidoglycan transglycosylase [Alphaproteobacteria bacterium]